MNNRHIFSRLFVEQDNWICSMAKSWEEIRANLAYHRYAMIQHLAKIYYWRNFPNDINGWKTTCRKGFDRIPVCKHNNKYPSFDKVYDELWIALADVFDSVHDSVIKDVNYDKKKDLRENQLPDITVKDSKFEQFCNDYITELSKKVSEKGNISSEENSDLIDSLLVKYPLNQN